jgi:mitofusin
VSTALSEEIRCLSVLVDEFNFPFHSERLDLNEYKRELIHHVENGMGSNLRARLSFELAKYIEKGRREMTGNK